MLPGNGLIAELKKEYRTKRPEIVKRLAEFKAVSRRGDREIFEELCFCIITAGSSARMGFRSVEALKDLLHEGSLRELQQRAREHHLRFWRLRPSYIVHTREYLRDHCGMRLRELLDSFASPEERRDFFARNRGIKGLGYKEASHFLRNIGYPGYAILDKHILNCLRDLRVISRNMRPAGRSRYLAIEDRLRKFSTEIGIDMDHLDLLLWSHKTGEILK